MEPNYSGSRSFCNVFSCFAVALWQTSYSNKKKVRLSYSEIVPTMLDISRYDYINYRLAQITVTNIGNRNIVIIAWGSIFQRILLCR
jgi:hypothetical protein